MANKNQSKEGLNYDRVIKMYCGQLKGCKTLKQIEDHIKRDFRKRYGNSGHVDAVAEDIAESVGIRLGID